MVAFVQKAVGAFRGSGTAKGLAAMLLGDGAGHVLRLATHLALTRLLTPAAFGITAIVWSVSSALMLLSDVGIGPAIMRDKDGENTEFLDTAWVIQFTRGALVFVAGSLLSWPVAEFYGLPDLKWLLPLGMGTMLIRGFDSTNEHLAQRRITLVPLAKIALTYQVLSLVACVGMAWWLRSPASLVIAALVTAAAYTALTHVALPGPGNRFRFERRYYQQIIATGRWVFVGTMLTLAGTRLDVFFLGKLLKVEVLGLYSIAVTLGSTFLLLSYRVVYSVVGPTWCEAYRKDPETFAEVVTRHRREVIQSAFTMALVGALATPLAIRVMYDKRYAGAAALIQIFVITDWTNLLQNMGHQACLAVGDVRTNAFSNALRLVVNVVACVIGYRFFGLEGCLFGMTVSAVASHAYVARSLRRSGVHVLLSDWRSILTLLALVTIGGRLIPMLAARLGVPSIVAEVVALVGVAGPFVWREARTRLAALARKTQVAETVAGT